MATAGKGYFQKYRGTKSATDQPELVQWQEKGYFWAYAGGF